MSFPFANILLDKNVARRVYENRARRNKGIKPLPLQTEAAAAYARLRALNQRLYLTQETENVLQLRPPLYAGRLLAQTEVLKKGRYLRRWARRLRRFVFTREDAIIIAYGSFGIDPARERLGVDFIVTGDLGLVTNFNTHYTAIQERFTRMTRQLPEPYNQAVLPQIVTPASVLAEW